MDDPRYFELEADRAFYRPVGVVSFDECVARVRAAIDRACREGASDLLVSRRRAYSKDS